MKFERMIDLSHPDEIEIRRLSAASKEEAENIRAKLERHGFTVTVKEASGEPVPGPYYAEILADKRTVPTAADLAARRASQDREDRARRVGYRLLWVGLGIALVLGLLFVLYALGPLIRLIRAIL